MKDYSAMSDFEINCEVARRLGMSHAFWFSESEDDFCEEIKPNQRGPIWQTGEFLVCGYRPSNGNVFNPCNSWDDAGPIIQENDISIIKLETKWMAITSGSGFDGYIGEEDMPCLFNEGFHVSHKNPLRAAMIVFLMIKDEQSNA